MMFVTVCFRLGLVASGLVGAVLTGCVAFDPAVQSPVEDLNERPYMAILPFGFDLDITKLSAVKTVDGTLSPEDEATQLADALRQIRQEARWLLLSRLATGQGFRMVPLAESDALAEELQLKPGDLPNAEQLAEFRCRLGANLVVAGSILIYGESSLAVVGRRDLRRYLVGDRRHWIGDRLESWHHPWKCGLRTPDEYAPLVWWGLSLRRRHAPSPGGSTSVRNLPGLSNLAGDGRVGLCLGRTQSLPGGSPGEEGDSTRAQLGRDHGIVRG